MARKDVIEVLGYADQQKQHRDAMRALYQDAFDLCRPNESEWSSATEGDDKQSEIFDDTAPDSVGKFAARFQKAMIPPDSNWFKFELPEGIKNRLRQENGDIAAESMIEQIELDLERQSDTFFDYIRRSNLTTKANKAFTDLAIGTLAMWISETDEQAMPFRFFTIPLHQLIIGEGADGEIVDVGRDYQMEVQNVIAKWGNTGNISQKIKELAEKNPKAKIEILEISVQDRVTKQYHYHVINVGEKEEIFYDIFDTSPAVVLRYRVNSTEAFGRGPCIFKLPTIRVLNAWEELAMRGAHRAVGGIFLAQDDGVLDPFTAQILPETVTVVADTERSLRELPYQGRIDFTIEKQRMLQDEIRRAFFAQQFASPMDPVRTATENSIAYQEMIEDMGGDFGRVQREFLDGLISRVTEILVRRGLMGEITVNREVVNYRYTSPMARAQEMTELSAIQNTIVMSNNLLGPQVTAMEYNLGRVARAIGDYTGADKSLLNTKEEKEQMQQQAAQMAQQQQAG